MTCQMWPGVKVAVVFVILHTVASVALCVIDLWQQDECLSETLRCYPRFCDSSCLTLLSDARRFTHLKVLSVAIDILYEHFCFQTWSCKLVHLKDAECLNGKSPRGTDKCPQAMALESASVDETERNRSGDVKLEKYCQTLCSSSQAAPRITLDVGVVMGHVGARFWQEGKNAGI